MSFPQGALLEDSLCFNSPTCAVNPSPCAQLSDKPAQGRAQAPKATLGSTRRTTLRFDLFATPSATRKRVGLAVPDLLQGAVPQSLPRIVSFRSSFTSSWELRGLMIATARNHPRVSSQAGPYPVVLAEAKDRHSSSVSEQRLRVRGGLTFLQTTFCLSMKAGGCRPPFCRLCAAKLHCISFVSSSLRCSFMRWVKPFPGQGQVVWKRLLTL